MMNMRNLKVNGCHHVTDSTVLSNAQCVSVDQDTGIVYCATCRDILGLDPIAGQICNTASLLDSDCLPSDGSGQVVGIHFLPDQQGVCIATNTGNLLLWSIGTGQMECVGTVESGFTAMSWSPDMELVVLATGQGTLIMMTREFDPITEKSQCPEDFGQAAFVTVGWGKKETQFHGSEGKAAARRKIEEIKPAVPWDDRQPRISWRGDGRFFVVSTISQESGARKLHVWTRECVHHSTNESVDGLEQALSWKPSGSLIASTQRKPNKHDVVFFEKNGLRHGEFTLPFGPNEVKVHEVMWNVESTVLAVWCEDLPTDNHTDNFLPKSYVQLWTVNNYHWYQKQSLEFDTEPSQRVVAVHWDPEHAYKLHIMCSGGQYLQYTWSWVTDHSTGRTPDDLATVAVIDGSKVLMTPLRQMIIPPPMSAYHLQLPTAVSLVAPAPDSNDFAVLLVDSRLAIYAVSVDGVHCGDDSVKLGAAGGNGFDIQCKIHSLKGMYQLEAPSGCVCFPLCFTHLTWISPNIFIFVGLNNKAKCSVIYCAELTDTISVRSSTDVENYVYTIACSPCSGSIAVELCDGVVLRYDTDSETLLPWETGTGVELQFPHPCSQMSVCTTGGEEVVLGLTDRYRFYVNDIEVASNCMSFAVHDEFLILSTLSHTCRCINLQTKVKDLPSLTDGKAHPFDESVRRVERGSRIVTVVPEDTRLILQMPRGNLETVHPRALVLSAVRRHLDRLQYKEAFVLMRKHRINMNLMIDHDPQSFERNVKAFISQIDLVNHINLFLTDLQEEDVTVTMYTAAYNRCQPVNHEDKVISKVDIACNSLRDALTDIDKNKYLLSILTTYVKKTTPELEAALHLVNNLRENPDKNSTVSAEETLKYLLFLVDVNELYDVALGTYNFDLVLMVAEKSQKDPKEYIPFLNSLRRMEENYQRFTIDKHLRRFNKALEHISKCGSDHFPECISHVEDHKLYVNALRLFPVSSSEYKELTKIYGNYLVEKNRNDEAGVMYIKAEEWSLALKAFQSCHNWRQIFCMTARLGYTAEEEAEIARETARKLKDNKKYLDAASVLELYAKDIEEAIVSLIEGTLWDEALRLMFRYKRTDFIETNLKEALIECHDQTLAALDSLRTEFERHKNRLQVVRDEKEKLRLELLEGDGIINNPDSDLYSDTSSAMGESVQSSQYTANSQRSTVISRGTGQSSRNRRKTEKKKWSLKQGSVYEDFALIDALAKIIMSVDGMRDEINALMKALVQFHFDEKASTLQIAYDKFLTFIEKSIPEIWTQEEGEDSSFKPVLGPNMTANAIAQAMQQGKGLDTRETIDPLLRVPPTLKKDVRWRLHMVQSSDAK